MLVKTVLHNVAGKRVGALGVESDARYSTKGRAERGDGVCCGKRRDVAEHEGACQGVLHVRRAKKHVAFMSSEK